MTPRCDRRPQTQLDITTVHGVTDFPQRSPGVLLSQVGERSIVYDLVSEMIHQLSTTAGVVLAACDGSTSISSAVDSWAETTGTDRRSIEVGVDDVLAEFESLGLVGRRGDHVPPDRPVGSCRVATGSETTGRVHHVIDHRIVFRACDEDLIARIDGFLDPGTSGSSVENAAHGADAAILVFDVTEDRCSGMITVQSDTLDRFHDRDALLEGLPTLLNQYAVWSHGCITLHAGAVRSPDGDVVLLPAESGSGKSTLTAMLIRAGWDYLGDEAIGIRSGTLTAVGYPKLLSIKRGGRAVLGLAEDSQGVDPARRVSSHVDPTGFRSDVARLAGDVGPVTRVVLPTYDPDSRTEVTELMRLEPHEAVVELLANTFNLARIGQSGLDTLCDLAESVRVERLSFGSGEAPVAQHFSNYVTRDNDH